MLGVCISIYIDYTSLQLEAFLKISHLLSIVHHVNHSVGEVYDV